MNKAEWAAVWRDVVGIWGGSPDSETIQVKLEAWTRRFAREDRRRFAAAIKLLERRSRLWPTVPEVHAVLEEITRRSTLTQRRPPTQPTPMTPAECRAEAANLREAATRSASEGGRRHLSELAAQYDELADKRDRGESVEFRPARLRTLLGAAPTGVPRRRGIGG